MARLETWYKQDLKRPLVVHKHTDVFNQDSKGNLIGVEIYSDGEPVVLSGSISGYCLLADGTTVPAVGASRSGNKASVLIPQTAYSVPGPVTITIKNVDGDNITTLCATVGVVRQSVSGNLVNPGSVVTDWSNNINAQLQAVQTAADNVGAIVAAPFDENTVYVVGNYVTNNGNLYRITADHAAGVAWADTAKTQCTVGNELFELKSALSQTTKNLMRLADVELTTVKGYTYSVENNVLSVSGESNASSADITLQLKDLMTLEAGTYTFSFENNITTNTKRLFLITDANEYINFGTFEAAIQYTVGTISETVNIKAIMIRAGSAGNVFTAETQLQFEKGNAKTGFVPPVTAKDSIARLKIDSLEYDLEEYKDDTGKKLNALCHTFDMSKDITIGAYIDGGSLVSTTTMNRASNNKLFRIHAGDAVELSIDSDCEYRAGFQLIGLDGTTVLKEIRLWTDTNLPVSSTIVCDDGYGFIVICRTDDASMENDDGLFTGLNLRIYTSYDYDEIPLYYGYRIQGNENEISINNVDGWAYTDFMPVQYGDIIKVTCRIAGRYSSGNVTGVIGFADKSMTSSHKWLLNNAIKGIETDTTVIYTDELIEIPDGVKYVVVTSNLRAEHVVQMIGYENKTKGFRSVEKLKNDLSGKVEIHVLSPEAVTGLSGESVLVKTPNGKNILIDTHRGNNSGANMQYRLIEQLISFNAKHLDYIMITHYHNDHIGGLKYWLENSYYLDRYIDLSDTVFIMPPTITLEGLANIVEKNDLVDSQSVIINALTNLGKTIIYPVENQELTIDGVLFRFNNCDHSVYEPSGSHPSSNYNDWSVVYTVEYGSQRFMDIGDLGPISESVMAGKLPKVNIMTAPHHGWDNGPNNLVPAFINNVDPDMILSPNGAEHYPDPNNTNGANMLNETSATQTWCEQNNVPNYATCINGPINVEMYSQSWRILGTPTKFIRNGKNWKYSDNTDKQE